MHFFNFFNGNGMNNYGGSGGKVVRAQYPCSLVIISAATRSIGSTTGCTITEKAPTRAFSWLKAPTSAFTFKTLC